MLWTVTHFFIELKTILADLYLTPADAQRIATDAGLDLTQIPFDAKAINNWHNILAVAIQSHALDLLLDKALGEYGQNQPLFTICETYRQFTAEGGQLEALPIGSEGSIVVTQGDFIGRDQTTYGDQIDGDKLDGDKVMRDNHEYHHHYAVSPETIASAPPMMALAPPNDYIQRSAEFNQLIDYLLAGNKQPVGITASIRGAGGFGKTTLAQAICHDMRIRDAFPDGILWTTVGDDKANVIPGLRKLYYTLTGREAQFVDQHDAATQLSNELANLRCV